VKPLPHAYDVHLTGGSSGYAVLSTPGIPDLRTAPPADFDGPGDAWSPEHLLLAAVQTCFLFTLRLIARASHVDFVSLEVDAAGTVNRQEGVTRFTEIVLRPRLVVVPGTDRERALRMLEKSEKHCLVSASLSTPVRLEPTITES
jgi:peroxiredoxin-like protein